MALQTVEMRELLDKLFSLEKECSDLIAKYELQKRELITALEFNDLGKFQFYDIVLLKETFEDKTKLEHEIEIIKEQIKLREIYERSETVPKGTPEYYQIFIEYWEQKLNVVRITKGEFSANRYKHVVDHQIMMAKERLAEAVA